MTFITAEMKPTTIGHFLVSCQIHAHSHGKELQTALLVQLCSSFDEVHLISFSREVTRNVLIVQTDGMNAFFTVEKCPEPIPVPKQSLRNVKHDEEEDEDDSDYLFNTIYFKPRAGSGQKSNIRRHFIAAEEVIWDYTPHLKPTDRYGESKG